MTEKKERQATVGIQFPKDMRKWLDDKAEQQDTSLSQVVRGLVRKAMEKGGVK